MDSSRRPVARVQHRIAIAVCLALQPLPSPAQSAPTAQEHTIRVNGIDLYYREAGHGEPVVLLHGFLHTGAMWDPLISDLAQHHRVIVPDLRGHGRSTDPQRAFTHRQAALDVHALLDSLELERVRAIGWATGAMVLLHLTTQQPRRVESMILLGPGHYWPQGVREHMRVFTFDRLPAGFLKRMRDIHPGGDEQIRALTETFNSFHDLYGDVDFTPAQLARIQARTLVVHGDSDELFPVEMALEIYRAVPAASLWVLPGLGHSLVYSLMRDNTLLNRRFADTTVEFFRKQ